MKKILLLIMLPLFLLIGCNKLNKYEEITYDKVMSKIEEKEDFVLFIGAASCPHCTLYKETVNSVVKKYQVKIYYIDVDNLSEEQISKFKTYINYNATPTTVFIYDGVEKTTYNRINGNLGYDKVVSRLKKEGYIKE